MKNKIIETHLKVARIYGQLSTATRLKVGCVIVKDDRIISIGYNGMPSGASNVCEYYGKTKPEVLHAEANSILKLAKSNESGLDSSMFTTYAPCIHCAKLILQSGVDFQTTSNPDDREYQDAYIEYLQKNMLLDDEEEQKKEIKKKKVVKKRNRLEFFM